MRGSATNRAMSAITTTTTITMTTAVDIPTSLCAGFVPQQLYPG
jgi:hypothetical protein